MTFLIIGSAFAPTIVDVRSAARMDIAPGLDRVPCERRLIGHWRRQPHGRLVCWWEPDIALNPNAGPSDI
jgi:hypothetical protein